MAIGDHPPNTLDVIPSQWAGITEAIEKLAPGDRYVHWCELPEVDLKSGIGRDAWWAALKLCRAGQARRAGLVSGGGQPLQFTMPAFLVEALHQADRWEPEAETGAVDWARFSSRGLAQEAVASSQLAGARVDWDVGKELLRLGRLPGDEHEVMVFNNHQALDFVRAQTAAPLSPALILELHRRLTQGHPDEARGSGRLRHDGEEGPPTPHRGTPVPAAGELPDRLAALCAFANGARPDFFVHPVIRAIILHFCLAHDRPFLHANGRAARALFYWAVARQGYPLFDFLSLSRVLLRAPELYRRSFQKTESDDNDLTYFILAQVEAIQAAVQDWRQDAARKRSELQAAAGRVQGFGHLNLRQQALLAHAVRRPGTTYVIAGHQRSHGVTHQTARDDLFDLVDRELLTVTRKHRVYRFQAAADLAGRVQSARRRSRRPVSGAAAETLPTSLL